MFLALAPLPYLSASVRGLLRTDALAQATLAQAYEAAAGKPSEPDAGPVRVVSVRGVIYEGFMEASRGRDIPGAVVWPSRVAREVAAAAADKTVSAIVLDVKSPGGSVTGVPEAAAAVRAAARIKPVVAAIDGIGASAAYWMASGASELVAAPSAFVGSVGVIATHEDWSGFLEANGVRVTHVTAGEHKAEGAPEAPLSDEGRAHMQATVDALYAIMTADIARARGRPVADVRGEAFGQGRVYLAAAALERGMVDALETRDVTGARLASGAVDAAKSMRGRALALAMARGRD